MSAKIQKFKSELLNNRIANFEQFALQLFEFQSQHCQIYKNFISHLHIDPVKVSTLIDIPFMPISFFKGHKIRSSSSASSHIFESSGTTGSLTSKHYVSDFDFYLNVTVSGFEHTYGKIEDYCILGLLPSYLERNNSSLVAMVDHFIKLSSHPNSGFYLSEFDELAKTLSSLNEKKQKALLIGVTFGLLDFAEKYNLDLSNITVMETGGMKGRREELTRSEVHYILKESWGLKNVHSEYGMTELFSQAYSVGDELFKPIQTMKVLCRDLTDPLTSTSTGRGGLNVIDLANIESCSFIATEDQGKVYEDGSFEVLGRIDHSDARGCNLMISDIH